MLRVGTYTVNLPCGSSATMHVPRERSVEEITPQLTAIIKERSLKDAGKIPPEAAQAAEKGCAPSVQAERAPQLKNDHGSLPCVERQQSYHVA